MDGDFFPEESRTSRRFVPKDHLSMFLAGSAAPLVHGDIKDLSELGACVPTDSALDSGGDVTINVRNGYSLLFWAEARIVWHSDRRRPHESFDCTHGILFTELSPFTRKLIHRLGGSESLPGPPSNWRAKLLPTRARFVGPLSHLIRHSESVAERSAPAGTVSRGRLLESGVDT